jgi:hypothetical protein
MRTRVKLAAVLACAASLGWAAQGQAAAVVQTRSFHYLHQVVASDRDAVNHIAFLNASESNAATVHFDPFDPSLGTLTDARLVLSSTQDFGFGVSVVGSGVAGLDYVAYTSAVRLDGSAVGGLTSAFSFSQSPAPCDTASAGFCLVQLRNGKAFDFDVAGLGPFLTGGAVDLQLGSTVTLRGAPAFLAANALLTEVGVLQWDGTLSLNYAYDPVSAGPPPAPVPEPAAWALMIAGFALTGATLRRRRVFNAAVSRPAP